MRSFISANKKVICISTFVILLLVIINTLLSAYLRVNYNHALDTCEGSEKLIHFHPTINQSGSFLNMRLDIRYDKPVFFVTLIVSGVASWICFIYLLYLKGIYNTTIFVLTPALLLLAGCLGRMTERVIWDYTFDFFAIKSMGILDILDVYFLVGCLGMIVVSTVFQYYENRKTRHMSKTDRQKYNADINKSFLALLTIKKAKNDKG